MSERVADSGDLRRWRTEVPNMVLDDERLGPYERALYVYYKRVAGDAGTCFRRRERIVKETGISNGKLAEVRANLVQFGYIEVTERPPQATEVRIVDVWERNFDRYRTLRHMEGTVHQAEGDPPPGGAEERTLSKKELSQENTHTTRAREETEQGGGRLGAIRSPEIEIVENVVGGVLALDAVDEIAEFVEAGYETGDFREAARIASDKGVRRWRFMRGVLRERQPGFAAAEAKAAAERAAQRVRPPASTHHDGSSREIPVFGADS